jgi:hypothetical protein
VTRIEIVSQFLLLAEVCWLLEKTLDPSIPKNVTQDDKAIYVECWKKKSRA